MMRTPGTPLRRAFLPVLMQFGLAALACAEDRAAEHPLAIHMNQWLSGTREWSTPNPDHDPGEAGSFVEFRVRWDWGPFRQQLLGKLFGVRSDGSTVLFWNLYATRNPAAGTVVYQQIGRNGAYIHGEQPGRDRPVAFGEVERLDATLYAPDGTIRVTRHENVFSPDGRHRANVYEQEDDGRWVLRNTWDWQRVAEDEVLGKGL